MFHLSQEPAMPMPVPDSPDGTPTKRQQIAELLEREIANNRWPVQTALPSENQLVQHFGVSRQTVRSAIATLQQRGLPTTTPATPPCSW